MDSRTRKDASLQAVELMRRPRRSQTNWSLAIGLGAAVCAATISLDGVTAVRSFEAIPGAVGTELPQLPIWPGDSASIAVLQNADVRLLFMLVGSLGALLLLVTLLNEAARLLIVGIADRLPLAVLFSLGAARSHLSTRLGKGGSRSAKVGILAGLPIALTLALAAKATWPAGEAPETISLLLPTTWLAASLLLVGMSRLIVLSQTKPRLLERGFTLLRTGGRATANPSEVLARSAVAVVQVASATIVIGTAVILLRAFGPADGGGTEARPAGDDMLMIQMRLEDSVSWQADPGGTMQRVFDDLLLIPDVIAVSASSQGTLLGPAEVRRVTTVCPECFRGTMPRAINIGDARLHVVTADFPRTAGITARTIQGTGRLERGEVLVNRAFAYQLFPNGDPLGKPLRIGDRPENWLKVIGVVPDILEPGIGSPGESPPAIYLAAEEYPTALRNLMVRFGVDAEEYIPLVEDSLEKHGIESGWSGTIGRFREEFRAPLRWFSWLFGLLAATVAMIASTGVHRTMHFLAEQRSREMGVRMALGASRGQIVRLIVSAGIRLSILGAYLGVIFLGGIARMLELRFAGPELFDPAVYLGLPIGLTVLAVAASWGAASSAAAGQPAQSISW